MSSPTGSSRPLDAPPAPVFGVNEMRLNGRAWLATAVVVLAVALLLPHLWKYWEPLPTPADYRLPYALSKDYWLYARRLEQVSDPQAVVLLGDSVVWGEYVRPEGTLSHFLNVQAGGGPVERFVNAGVNGMFPLALEGLVNHYTPSLRDRQVLLHCNLLWMTSPKADLSTAKEESFNHARLVAQFQPRIPCYRADFSDRLGVKLEHQLPFLQWVGHVETVYFEQKSIPLWTLAESTDDPPRYPNLLRNPLAQVTFRLPDPFGPDPERGPGSARHRGWNRPGARPVEFEWVTPDNSLQWAAFQRVVQDLQARGARVLVVFGPFNQGMLAEGSRTNLGLWRETVLGWLASHSVPAVAPAELPAELYADASHPLTEGYARLAESLWQEPRFQAWLAK